MKSRFEGNLMKRSQRGQSLVEFALVLPFFALLMLGILDFGWALKSYVTLTNSAREGARLGITGATSTQVASRVVTHSTGMLTSSNVVACGTSTTNSFIAVCGAGGTPGGDVKVELRYNYVYITPIAKWLSSLTGTTTLPLKTSTTMRME
jgi:Flp pilus assembly protein TadG